jgi:hypothetical protein
MNTTTRGAQRRLLAAGLLLIGMAYVGTRWAPTSTVMADWDNPATCHAVVVDGVEEDRCIGNPDSPGGVNHPYPYFDVIPRLEFGIGIGGG